MSSQELLVIQYFDDIASISLYLERIMLIEYQNISCLVFFRLAGRGTVEFTIEKVDGSSFSPEAGGELRKTATLQVLQISHHVVIY